MPWAPLPSGEDIPIAPGDAVAAVVSVGPGLTRAKLEAAMTSHFEGLILDDYAEQGQRLHLGPDPDTSRKYVAVRAHSTTYSGSLAWSRGIFLVAPNLYTIVEAWKLPAGSAELSAPTPTPPGPRVQSSSRSAAGWAGAVTLVGAAAYLVWAYRGPLASLRLPSRLLGR